MEQIRDLVYRVYTFFFLSDQKNVIYEDTSLSAAEAFALSWNGGDEEIYIEKVYRLRKPRDSKGREL